MSNLLLLAGLCYPVIISELDMLFCKRLANVQGRASNISKWKMTKPTNRKRQCVLPFVYASIHINKAIRISSDN